MHETHNIDTKGTTPTTHVHNETPYTYRGKRSDAQKALTARLLSEIPKGQ